MCIVSERQSTMSTNDATASPLPTFSKMCTSNSTGPSLPCWMSVRWEAVDNRYAAVRPARPLPTTATLMRRGGRTVCASCLSIYTRRGTVVACRTRVGAYFSLHSSFHGSEQSSAEKQGSMPSVARCHPAPVRINLGNGVTV